jgi:hypothetical protein
VLVLGGGRSVGVALSVLSVPGGDWVACVGWVGSNVGAVAECLVVRDAQCLKL